MVAECFKINPSQQTAGGADHAVGPITMIKYTSVMRTEQQEIQVGSWALGGNAGVRQRADWISTVGWGQGQRYRCLPC